MGHNEDRELVPLKSDFDITWRGYRRSQVQFYIQQTETEVRMLTEDRDSALSQVTDLSGELDESRAEVESLRQQLDESCKTPIDESALSDRLRRMVRLANDEAAEVQASAQATAEHEWARSEQAAAELRERYERLVAEADQWRLQAEQQRNESLAETRDDIQRMAREAEAYRRKLDTEAEERRTQIEQDFEISMAARRDEEMRIIAERERASREAAQRRVHEATVEAQRRLRRADEYSDTMLRVQQDLAQRVRAAQRVLAAADPFLAASEQGDATNEADAYVARTLHSGVPVGEPEDVSVPKQRAAAGLEPVELGDAEPVRGVPAEAGESVDADSALAGARGEPLAAR